MGAGSSGQGRKNTERKKNAFLNPFTLLLAFLVVVLVLLGAVQWKFYGAWKQVSAQMNDLQAIKPGVQESAPLIGMTIMDRNIEWNPAIDGQVFSPDQLTSEFPMEVRFYHEEGYEISIAGVPLVDHTAQVVIPEMEFGSPSVEIQIKNIQTGQQTAAYIKTYPDDFPLIMPLGESPIEGRYYFCAGNFIVKMDTRGKIVYYKRGVSAHDPGVASVRDFKRAETPDGKVRYVYMQERTPKRTPHELARYVIMDERYNIIDSLDYMHKSDLLPENVAPEGHEFMYFDDGHYLLQTYFVQRVTNIPDSVEHGRFGAVVSSAVLQEIKDGQLVFEWDSADHPELYEMSVEGNEFNNTSNFTCDYMHINSMDVDPRDQNLICSFRHLDAVLKLDRATGEILWVLGGKGDQFGLTEEQKFSRQHYARYTDNGTITLFDNANDRGYSRVLEFKLDEENKQAVEFQAYESEQQKRLWMGSAQRLTNDRDIFLIGWGGRGGDGASDLLLSEIDYSSGKVLFEVICPTDNYRVYKFDS